MNVRVVRGAAVSLVALFAACSSKSDPPPAAPPTLTVSPTSRAIAPNDPPFAFSATLSNSTAPVAWSIVDSTCANAGSLGATTGIYTPPATNDTACGFTARATAGSLTADALVSLAARSAAGTTMTVTPASGSVTAGSATPFTFFMDSNDATTAPACTVSSALATCAEGGATDGHTRAFEVTPAGGLLTTTTNVEVTLTLSTLTAVVPVTVRPSVLAVSGPATIRAGGAQGTFSVTAPSVGGEPIVWSVEPAIGVISAAGVYTSPATFTASTPFSVVATIGEARGTATVSLAPAAVTVTASASSVGPGGSVTLTAAVDPAAASPGIAWTQVGPAGGTLTPAADRRTAVYAAPATVTSPSTATVSAEVAGGAASTTVAVVTTATPVDAYRAWSAAASAKAAQCLGKAPPSQAEVDATAGTVAGAVADGRLTFQPAAVDFCVAAIEATTCAEALHQIDRSGCIGDIFAAAVPLAGACTDGMECAVGYCDFGTWTCPGTCTALRTEGQSCSTAYEPVCASGTVCDAVALTCVPVTALAAGAPCSGVPTEQCPAGTVCRAVDRASPTARTCAAPAALGGNCGDDHRECALPLVCDDFGYCTHLAGSGNSCLNYPCNSNVDYCGASTTCVPRPTVGEWCDDTFAPCAGAGVFCESSLAYPVCKSVVGVGGDCTRAYEQQVQPACAGGAICVTNYSVPGAYKCVAPTAAGAACYPWGLACVAGHYCDGDYASNALGTCVPQKSSGAACGRDGECAGGACVAGLCALDGYSCY